MIMLDQAKLFPVTCTADRGFISIIILQLLDHLHKEGTYC